VITAIAPNSDVHVVVVINGLLYLSSALVIATRLPEASGRWTAPPTGEAGHSPRRPALRARQPPGAGLVIASSGR